MADWAGFLAVSHSNTYFFTNSCNNDMMVYPETSNQRIIFGTTSNTPSVMVLNSNNMQVVGDVYINSNIYLNRQFNFRGIRVLPGSNQPNMNVTSTVSSIQGFSNETSSNGVFISGNYIKTAGSIIPVSNLLYDLGSSNMRFRSIFLASNTIDLGGTKLTVGNTGLSVLDSNNSNAPLIVSQLQIGTSSNAVTLTLDATNNIRFSSVTLSNGIQQTASNSTVGGWSNNSSNVFIFNSNIGIGKSNPTFPLDITGDLNFTGTLRQGGVPYVGSQWSNVGNTVFLLQSNVGIGTSNPLSRLAIESNVSIGAAYSNIGAPANGLIIQGNVGIGKSNPTTTLDIIGSLQVSSNIITPGLLNRIWDFSGTATDSSKTPGPISASNITGTAITISTTITPFSNINTEGSILLPGTTGNFITAALYGSTFAPITFLPDLTVESWVYYNITPINANVGIPYLIGQMVPTTFSSDWAFGIDPSNKLAFSGVGNVMSSSNSITLSNWTHIAACYKASTKAVQLFINGTLQTLTISSGGTGGGTTTGIFTAALSGGSGGGANKNLIIGQYNNVCTNAYIYNLRLVNAVLYTSNFIPPTTPLQVYGSNNTILLLKAPLYNPITFTNTVQTYDSQRVHSLPQDALIYADCYGTNLPNIAVSNTPFFDSNMNKCISFTRSPATQLQFGPQLINIATKGFTSIVKFRFTGTTIFSYETIHDFNCLNTGGVDRNIMFRRNGTNQSLDVQIYGVNGSPFTTLQTPNIIHQNITYVAAFKYDPFESNGSIKIFINGAIVITNTNQSSNIGLDRIVLFTNVGRGRVFGEEFNGDMFSFTLYNRALTDNEIIDASQVLQTLPSLPLNNIFSVGNVNGKPALNIKADGGLQVAGLITATNNQSYSPQDMGVSNLSITGYIVGSVPTLPISPFNGNSEGSMYFQNTSTSNYINLGSNLPIFSGPLIDTTIEGWVYLPSAVGSGSNGIIINRIINSATLWGLQITGGTNMLTGYILNSSSLYANVSNVTPIQPNTWTHIAMSLSNSNLSLYVNGIQGIGSNLTLANSNSTAFTTIIGGYTPLANQMFNGYLTNMRITTNFAAYNGNFIPTTVPLNPSPTGTTLLLLRAPQNPGRVLIPKIGGTTLVQAYPPAAMTNYVTNIQNSSYGTGTYIASASSITSASDAWCAFDKLNGIFPNIWVSANSTYTANVAYSGSVNTVDKFGTNYGGEWVQLQMPYSVVLTSYSLQCQTNSTLNMPTVFSLLGSVDGQSWNIVNQQLFVTWTSNSQVQTFNILTVQAFSYYRLVTNRTTNILVAIGELIFYGTQESISITPDGQVGLGVTKPIQQLEVAGNAIFSGNISAGNLGMFRNRIINGDMRIAQRGISATYSVDKNYLIDRMYVYLSTSGGTLTVSQMQLTANDIPYQRGHTQALNVLVATANASTMTFIGQHIEPINFSDFMWGTNYALPVVLSFWILSNVASGTIMTAVIKNGVSCGYCASYTYVTSNVWQFVTLYIPPPINIWPIGNDMNVVFNSAWVINATSANTWQSGNIYGFPGLSLSTFTVLGNYVRITGVQLEKGTIATPFEYRPYALELQLCQRYYYRISAGIICIGHMRDTVNADCYLKHPVEMRVFPTIAKGSDVLNANSGNINATISTILILGSTGNTTAIALRFVLGTASTIGYAVLCFTNSTPNSYVEFLSEYT